MSDVLHFCSKTKRRETSLQKIQVTSQKNGSWFAEGVRGRMCVRVCVHARECVWVWVWVWLWMKYVFREALREAKTVS